MIDRRTIELLMAYIQEMLNRLSVQRGKSLAELSGDFISVDASLWELQTTLKAVTDIATYVVAGASLGTPSSRPDSVELLARNDIVSRPLADRLVQALSTVSPLTYHDLPADVATLHNVMHNDLGDIEDFCAEVSSFLDRNAVER